MVEILVFGIQKCTNLKIQFLDEFIDFINFAVDVIEK